MFFHYMSHLICIPYLILFASLCVLRKFMSKINLAHSCVYGLTVLQSHRLSPRALISFGCCINQHFESEKARLLELELSNTLMMTKHAFMFIRVWMEKCLAGILISPKIVSVLLV